MNPFHNPKNKLIKVLTSLNIKKPEELLKGNNKKHKSQQAKIALIALLLAFAKARAALSHSNLAVIGLINILILNGIPYHLINSIKKCPHMYFPKSIITPIKEWRSIERLRSIYLTWGLGSH